MVSLDGHIREAAAGVLGPLLHVAAVDGAVCEAVKGGDGKRQGRQRCVAVLHGHHDVVDTHGRHLVEQPLALLHLLQTGKVALLKNLSRNIEGFYDEINIALVQNGETKGQVIVLKHCIQNGACTEGIYS